MKINKELAVCFTGYRTEKIMRTSSEKSILQQIYTDIEMEVSALCEQGYTTFLSGMVEGFDMMAAEVVLRTKSKYPSTKLVAVIPFVGQELGYTQRDKERYKMIYEQADEVVFTSDTYNGNAYFLRNDYLLEHSSVVVCYYDGQRGGTMYTYNRARKFGMSIINLCETA